jgi:hypothetical protein
MTFDILFDRKGIYIFIESSHDFLLRWHLLRRDIGHKYSELHS